MATPLRIVDVWMQPSSESFLDHEIFDSLRRWGAANIPAESSDACVRRMDKAGVRIGLLSAWSAPHSYLISNAEVERAVRAHPDRLRGICAVNIRQPMRAIAEMRDCIKRGFVGLRLLPWLWELPPNDRRFYPLYAECVTSDVPFCLQVGHTGPLMPSEFGRPIPYLDDVAREFPDLKIVGGHVGFPWTNEMLALAMKYPNVYIDTSAYVCKRYPQELVTYMRANPKHRVMFGSNYPMLTADRCLEGFDTLGLGQQATEAFLFKNAEKVFKLSPLPPLPCSKL